jgi:hypothetical protein
MRANASQTSLFTDFIKISVNNVIDKFFKVLSIMNDMDTFVKVHKHEIFFFTFFAETETIWSQGPVTRDF